MRGRWPLVVGCAALAALAACTGPEVTLSPLEVGPLDTYASDVQPQIAERCASGGCHGRPDRRLSLYAPGQHRADPAQLHLPGPLSPHELEENARRLAAFAHATDAPQSELVCKPLSIAAGGCAHGGGDVFFDRTDPTCLVLERWIDDRAPADGGMP